MFEPVLVTAAVTGILEKLHVRYFIGGSLASTLHGMVRTTQDSDVIAELSEEHVEAFVANPEDTLLAKLEWFRMGGEVSERQWRDVIGILEVQGGRLDFYYLRQWAKELKVSDLLEQALIEATI